MRRKATLLIAALALSGLNIFGLAPAAHSCAEFDPTIGCIGRCARPLQGSVTCPNP